MILKNGMELGKYRIIRQIGVGGMAQVFEAEDTDLGRRVALKLLPPVLAIDPERVARFMKEVRNSAALSHPHIVPVYDVGEGDGFYFYTMQLLEGGDLKQRINSGLTPLEALAILKQVADALKVAHSKGIVHRDVKPENVMFDTDGRAILTDLGIARAVSGGTRMTKTGMSIGTPHYMSPEQARGKGVDGRSDIYSLGVMFHEMLTGRVPYDAEESFAVGLMHINDPIPVLPSTLSSFQPMLNAMLAKEPEHRYPDCASLIRDVELMEQGKKPSGICAPSNEGNSGHWASSARDWSAFRAGGIGAVCALLLAVGGYLFFGNQEPTPRAGGGGGIITKTSPATAPSDTVLGIKNDSEETASVLQKEVNPKGSTSGETEAEALFKKGNNLVASMKLTTPPNENAFDVFKKAYYQAGLRSELYLSGLDSILSAYNRLMDSVTSPGSENFPRAVVYGGSFGPVLGERLKASKFLTKAEFDTYLETNDQAQNLFSFFQLNDYYSDVIGKSDAKDVLEYLKHSKNFVAGLKKANWYVNLQSDTIQNWMHDIEGLEKKYAAQAKQSRSSRALNRADGRNWIEPITKIEFIWYPQQCGEIGSLLSAPGRQQDEVPAHKVCVDSLWISKTEITNRQYRKIMGKSPSGNVAGVDLSGDNYPVVNVSWEEAKAFAEKLAQKTKHRMRLPTEAEWELIARQNKYRKEASGKIAEIHEHANIADLSAKKVWEAWNVEDIDDKYAATSPVCSFNDGKRVLCDIVGNAAEWCEDDYDSSAYSNHSSKNPLVSNKGNVKVVRGGSFASKIWGARIENREKFQKNQKAPHIGFRIVMH